MSRDKYLLLLLGNKLTGASRVNFIPKSFIIYLFIREKTLAYIGFTEEFSNANLRFRPVYQIRFRAIPNTFAELDKCDIEIIQISFHAVLTYP
jgi:hypothetical protein